MNKKQKGFATMLLFIICLVVASAGIGFYYYIKDQNDTLLLLKSTKPLACKTDSMMCSNGSFVERTGPNCEFSCASEPDKQNIYISVVVPNPPTQATNPFTGVGYFKGNFKVITSEGKSVSVFVGQLKKTYLNMPHDITSPPDNWPTFYNLVKNRSADYKGMPLTIKMKGYWVDDVSFEATEISWQIGLI